MTKLELFQPDSVAQAIDLLRGSRPPIDSPTQRRYRSDKHLEAAFKHRLRRPEWVWAARRDDQVVGTIAAVGPSCDFPRGIDHISDPGSTTAEHADFTALAARATDDWCRKGCTDVFIYGPPDVDFDTPAISRLTTASGTVDGHHLWRGATTSLKSFPDSVAASPGDLRLERLARADDQRLLSVYPQVFAGSLDESHREAEIRLGFEAAWREELERLLADDPVDCIRLAFDANEDCVGIVSGRVWRGGPAFVLFVGVAEPFRGQGYGRQLLADMTRELIAEGATMLIADTDYRNVPMGKAFADVGWVQTESRLDLSRSTPIGFQ